MVKTMTCRKVLAPLPAALIAAAVAVLLALPGCGGKRAGEPALAKIVVGTAEKYLGTPYVSGGRGPKGFDCSGLVWYVYRLNGIELPESSYRQSRVGREVDRDELMPGDLVFFRSGRRVDHVGLYVGDGFMIHAPGRGKKVRRANLEERYYRQHYVTARRVL
ncbi:MAG: C40 family peptidase [Deltaproteobacteria bacterium]|jgi:cell wall-associated NlpC family hydrolase|nr:C40 family peptidase [Deltaproteobacteria bacterium]